MSDDKFKDKIHQALDDRVDNLDASTLSRLNQARHKALESKHQPYFLNLRLPATALAAITVAVIVGSVWNMQSQQTDPLIASASHNDFELISSNIEINLLEEIDFVTWLVDDDAS